MDEILITDSPMNSPEEVILTESDDDLNMGLVISDVKSLADDPLEITGNANNPKCEDEKFNVVHKFLDGPMMSGQELNSSCHMPPSSPIPSFAPEMPSQSCSSSGVIYLNTDEPSEPVVPPSELISSVKVCLAGWISVFPWLCFNTHDYQFSCSACDWGYQFPQYHNIYKLKCKKDLLSVAAKLRSHSKKKYHIAAERERKLNVCRTICSFIKEELIHARNIEPLLASLNENFPHEIKDCKLNMALLVKDLALAIEKWYFVSLKKSPYFSVIICSSDKYLIVRWITEDNLIVEHVFFVNMENHILPGLAYLQYRGVDMNRMISYSNLDGKAIGVHGNSLLHVADRCCPFDHLLNWLKCCKSLLVLIRHLEAVALFREKYDCQILRNITGSTHGYISTSVPVHKMLKGHKCVSSMLSNATYLDRLRNQSNDEKFKDLNFEELRQMGKDNPVTKVVLLLPILNDMVEKFDGAHFLRDISSFNELIGNSYKLLTKYLSQNDPDTKNEFMVLDIIRRYVSHIIVMKNSQSMNNAPWIRVLSSKIKNLHFDSLDQVFAHFNKKLCGGKGFHQLMQLHQTFGRQVIGSPLRIFSKLQENPSLSAKYPEMMNLGQMIMVLPTLNAHIERYSFDIAAAETFLIDKVERDLLPYFLYIYLEAPDTLGNLVEIITEYMKS